LTAAGEAFVDVASHVDVALHELVSVTA